MSVRIGGLLGLKRRGTITSYFDDGTVEVKMDDGTSVSQEVNTHNLEIFAAYSSKEGAFIGGYPSTDTPVIMEQGQGSWYISGYAKPDDVYESGLMDDLRPGRLLLQTDYATNKLYLDKNEGIVAGTSNNYFKLDTENNILSNNFNSNYRFTSADRSIIGAIKRDIKPNALRDVEYSSLTSTQYDESLHIVGMDPGSTTSSITITGLTRNPELSENKNITYEFSNYSELSYFEKDEVEIIKYDNTQKPTISDTFLRYNSRTDSFGLNLHNPNHLIEEIKGTGVDIFGNVIDINRCILPLGKDKNTFTDNDDKASAFSNIRAIHRKSIAYHFEINARKDNDILEDTPKVYTVQPSTKLENYARNRSTFFFDIDKEGQFKINIPASSESGNIPLPLRYVNSSVLAFENKQIDDPNAFISEEDNIDIYVDSFGPSRNNEAGISIDSLPIDRISNKQIKLNTSYHNITSAGYQFTKKRLEDDAGGLLIRYMPNSYINQVQSNIQIDNIITTEIKTSGKNANAGGRSGFINMDGFLNLNIGANTVDRQSLWLDTAGGIISTIGRDRNGISYCASLDGDMLVQIGGVGIGNSYDSRFSKENDGARSGVLDIRVIKSDGQLTVVRIDSNGATITTYGRCEISSQQDLILKSNTNILMEAPNISFFYETMPRLIKRNGEPEVA